MVLLISESSSFSNTKAAFYKRSVVYISCFPVWHYFVDVYACLYIFPFLILKSLANGGWTIDGSIEISKIWTQYSLVRMRISRELSIRFSWNLIVNKNSTSGSLVLIIYNTLLKKTRIPAHAQYGREPFFILTHLYIEDTVTIDLASMQKGRAIQKKRKEKKKTASHLRKCQFQATFCKSKVNNCEESIFQTKLLRSFQQEYLSRFLFNSNEWKFIPNRNSFEKEYRHSNSIKPPKNISFL